MMVRKHLRLSGIGICTVLLAVPMFGGCSISSRSSVEMENLQAPSAPVLQNVYDRSVDKDVYSSGRGRGESLIPEPSLKPQDSLRDSVK
ncbi:MAG: hypothetical protein ACQEXX_28155 [Bacillota bacterium]